VTAYVALHKLNEGTFPSLAALMREISKQVSEYGSLTKIPAEAVGNTRNDMYLVSEAIRFLMKDRESDLSKEDITALNNYKRSLDDATKFIPFWVKIVVAIALGLAWRRAGPCHRPDRRRVVAGAAQWRDPALRRRCRPRRYNR
jgi:inorganic phosphate transporter, PiT family